MEEAVANPEKLKLAVPWGLEATNIVIHSLLPSKIQYTNIMNINTNIFILNTQFAAITSTIYKYIPFTPAM